MWYKIKEYIFTGGVTMDEVGKRKDEEKKRGRRKGSSSKHWKEEEYDFIMEHIDLLTIEEMAFILKREYGSVCARIIVLNKKHGHLVELTTQEKLDLKMIFKAFGLTRNDLREERLMDYEIDLICRRFKKFDPIGVRNLVDKSLKTSVPLPIRRERVRKKPDKKKLKTLYALEENYYGASTARVNI